MFAFPAEAFQRHVFHNLAMVILDAGHQRIVHGALNLVDVFGLARYFVEPFAELHPCEGDTGLHRVGCGQLLQALASIPAFQTAGSAGDVDFLLHDVVPCGQGGLQVLRIGGEAVHLQQAHIA